MLCTVIGKDPAHFLHTGNQQHISDKDDNANRTFDQIQKQCIADNSVQEAADDHGQQEEQQNRQSQSHEYRDTDNRLLEGFITQLLFQPKVKFRRFLRFTIRIGGKIGRTHQCLYTGDLGIKEVDCAANKGPAQNGFLLRQLSSHYFDGQLAFGSDHDGILLGTAHHDALDQCLTADHRFEFLAAGLRILVFHGNVPHLLGCRQGDGYQCTAALCILKGQSSAMHGDDLVTNSKTDACASGF